MISAVYLASNSAALIVADILLQKFLQLVWKNSLSLFASIPLE